MDNCLIQKKHRLKVLWKEIAQDWSDHLVDCKSRNVGFKDCIVKSQSLNKL